MWVLVQRWCVVVVLSPYKRTANQQHLHNGLLPGPSPVQSDIDEALRLMRMSKASLYEDAQVGPSHALGGSHGACMLLLVVVVAAVVRVGGRGHALMPRCAQALQLGASYILQCSRRGSLAHCAAPAVHAVLRCRASAPWTQYPRCSAASARTWSAPRRSSSLGRSCWTSWAPPSG